ncbi:MAG: hypothetical protein IJ190_08115 [Prevotella sp.]|nr:hypothetical protein [Prevotella sp.]
MRRSIIMIFALMMLMACGSKKAQTGSVDTAVVDSAVILAQEEMTGVIKELYAAEAKNEGDIDQLYACHVWREAVAAVEKKDSHVAEIGFFNENYWTQMQDSNPADLEARDIKFEQVDIEKGRAVVSFILHSSVQTVRQKFEFCHEDGNWRVHNIIRYFKDADGKDEESNLLEGMRSYLDEPLEVETQELTFANMAGIYDDEGQEARICLYEEGRATWGMIGSLNYTEYTYTINGHTICLKSIDDESGDDCYEYDENTRTLKDKQGAVYYRQVVE